jgi:hypothetical protein
MTSLRWQDLPAPVLDVLRRGAVIPAHPLALDAAREFDRISQRALTRYYIDAGAGGLAVGVHSTQFAIRERGLYEPVLKLAAETAAAWSRRPLVMIGGAVGRTAQAVAEARIARGLGYHAVLLSLAAMKGASEDELVAHCAAVAAEMPLIGFYLQPAVGGVRCRALLDALRRDRERGRDQGRAVQPLPRRSTWLFGVVAGAAPRTASRSTPATTTTSCSTSGPFVMRTGGREVTMRFRGGLLGHWGVWTSSAVKLLARIQAAVAADAVTDEILALDTMVTDCNAVVFDVAHDFAGCIPGCHECCAARACCRPISASTRTRC